MGWLDYDFGPNGDLADLDFNGKVDAFEAALFFNEMEREDRALECGSRSLWADERGDPDVFEDEADDDLFGGDLEDF